MDLNMTVSIWKAGFGNDLRAACTETICPLTGMELTVARTSNTVAENSVQTAITVLCLFRNFLFDEIRDRRYLNEAFF